MLSFGGWTGVRYKATMTKAQKAPTQSEGTAVFKCIGHETQQRYIKHVFDASIFVISLCYL